MANMPLTDIGITPRKASQFASKGIETVTDLLGYYPTKYLDFRNPISFAEGKYHQGEHVAIKGKVVSGRVIDGKHYMLRLTDGNTFCTVFWFNQPFRTRQFSVGDVIALGGVVSWNEQYNNMTMATPDFVTTDIASAFSIQPVYRKIKGMSVEYLEDAIKLAMPYTRECSTETLSLAQMRALRVPPIAEAIHMAHQPTDEKEIRLSRKRRAVDVLYPFCYELEAKKAEAAKVSFCRIKSTRDVLNKMQGVLPFKLTEDQKNAAEHMLTEMEHGERVDTLVQGDVGCGKTVVAEICALAMAMNGFQCAVMAPTVVLATQHYEEFSKILGSFGYKTVFLRSGMKAKEEKSVLEEIESGKAQIIVGTHSVISGKVKYHKLGFYGDEEGDRKLSEWEEDAPTCNISDIYDALLHNDLDKWEANFKYVPLSHPAASAWAVFKGMGERVQPNIVGGLNTRLQLFMTYKVRRVISNDDIRLANLGAEKTALFLIISDDNASMQLLSSLLLSFLFKDLKEAFDAVGGEGRIPVNVVADELANTGVWPNFEKTIATARSRKIAVSLILQSLPQLTQLYGEENAETIIGCCNTMLVLGCNDKYTAEYISDKSGIVTIRAKSVSDTRASSTGNRGVMQGYSLSEGDGKRNLVNPDEVQHLDKEQILIMTNGQNMLEAKRFGFIHHPLFNDPHFVPTKWAELPKTADLYPNARKHDAIESRESSFGDIQRQKEINTDITQKRSEERMKPRLSKKDLLATDEPAPKKKNAFKK